MSNQVPVPPVPSGSLKVQTLETAVLKVTDEIIGGETTTWKDAVVVATTAAITLSGTQTIDTIVLAADDRVLVKDQASGIENGIYVVSAGAWTRADDATVGEDLGGASVTVNQGAVNGGNIFICMNAIGAGIVGTDALTFSALTIGGVTPGGADTQVQYNDSGTFGGDAAFVFDDGTGTLTVTNVTSSGTITAGTLTDGTFSTTAGAITGVASLTATGTITGGTLTDGTLSSTAGTVTGAVAITASGAITGGTLTDGTLSSTAGTVTGAVAITASGAITGGTLTDGTLSSTAGTVTGAVAITASGAITGGSLTDGTATLASGGLTLGALEKGTATLVAGTVTVATTAVTATDTILVSLNTPIGGALGSHYSVPVASITAGVSFVINAVDLAGVLVATDVSTVNYLLIH